MTRTPSSLSEAQPFERHPDLAAWIEKLANVAVPGWTMDDWQQFTDALNAALTATSDHAGAVADAGERISRLAAELVVSGWMAGGHGVEEAKKKAERRLLEFACAEISRDRASRPTPTPDREAVADVEIPSDTPQAQSLREALEALRSRFAADAIYSPYYPGHRMTRTEKKRARARDVVETVDQVLAALTPPHAVAGDMDIEANNAEANRQIAEDVLGWLKDRGLYDPRDYECEGPDVPELLTEHEEQIQRLPMPIEPVGYLYAHDGEGGDEIFSRTRKNEYMRNPPWTETPVFAPALSVETITREDVAREILFDYINYRGEKSHRRARPISTRFGSSEWHQKPQWLMLAIDLARSEEREFAMADMTNVVGAESLTLLNGAGREKAKSGGAV